MNILMISPDYPPSYGGIGTHVYHLTKNLRKQGHTVTLFVTRVNKEDSIYKKTHITRKNGIIIVDIPNKFYDISEVRALKLGNYYSKEIAIFSLFGNILTDILMSFPLEKYDIIHIHDGYAAAAGIILKKYLKIPLITTIHSMHASKKSIKYYLREYLINNSDSVIAVSHYLKDMILSNYHISGDKINVIYNSINVNRYISSREKNFSSQITFCGSLEEVKGVVSLINVFSQVLKEINYKKIVLNIIGSGSLEEEIQSLIYFLKLDKNVHLYRNIKNTKVLEIFQRSNCVVIPSLQESFATVGLEAMSVKTALISANVGGMKEMVIHDETGFLYEVNDVSQMKGYIIDLLKNPKKAVEFGKEGYQQILKNFTCEINVEKLLDLYRKVINNEQVKC